MIGRDCDYKSAMLLMMMAAVGRLDDFNGHLQNFMSQFNDVIYDMCIYVLGVYIMFVFRHRGGYCAGGSRRAKQILKDLNPMPMFNDKWELTSPNNVVLTSCCIFHSNAVVLCM